jgi:hypothetical protein
VTGIAFAGRMFVAEGGIYSEDTVRNILKSQVHFCSLEFKDTQQMQFVELLHKVALFLLISVGVLMGAL